LFNEGITFSLPFTISKPLTLIYIDTDMFVNCNWVDTCWQ